MPVFFCQWITKKMNGLDTFKCWMDLAKHDHHLANVSRVNMINLKLLQCRWSMRLRILQCNHLIASSYQCHVVDSHSFCIVTSSSSLIHSRHPPFLIVSCIHRDDPWPSKDQVGQWYKYRPEENLKSEYHLAGTSALIWSHPIERRHISVVEAFENW